MNRQERLSHIKSVVLSFLYQDVKETEYSPVVVLHPIFESAIIMIKNKNGKNEMINVLESKENLNAAFNHYKNVISNANSIYVLYSIIRKSYRLTFYSFIRPYLTEKESGELLSTSWTSSENPNGDKNVPLDMIVNFFRNTDKKYLMEKDEHIYYHSLPDKFIVYRGVAVGRNPNGLSWTVNLNTAEWFANRFNTINSKGYIQSVEINKSDVLAYFNRRGEDEIVIDTSAIKDKIKII